MSHGWIVIIVTIIIYY